MVKRSSLFGGAVEAKPDLPAPSTPLPEPTPPPEAQVRKYPSQRRVRVNGSLRSTSIRRRYANCRSWPSMRKQQSRLFLPRA